MRISSVPVVSLNPSLRDKLEVHREKAVELKTIDQDKRDREDKLIDVTNNKIHHILCNAKESIDQIDWDVCWENNIGPFHHRYRQEDGRMWEDTFSKLNEIINKEILAIDDIKLEISKVKISFEESLNTIYQSEMTMLDCLKAQFNGSVEAGEKNSTLMQVSQLVGPAILGVTFRLTPIGLGVTLLMAPLIPAAWLVASWKDEWSEYKYQALFDTFKANKNAFVRDKLDELLVKDKKRESKASRYLDYVGKKRRAEIHEDFVKLISILDFLLGTANSSTEVQRKINENHFQSVSELYVRNYLDTSRDRSSTSSMSGDSWPSREVAHADGDGKNKMLTVYVFRGNNTVTVCRNV